MKKIVSVFLILLVVFGLTATLSGCKDNSYPPGNPEEDEILPTEEQQPEQQPKTPEEAPPLDPTLGQEVEAYTVGEYTLENGDIVENPVVTIEMEQGGKIVIELLPEYAPNTVKNFIKLINEGYYDGVVFHRIVPNFMIQGGDPTGTGSGGPGYSIKGEFSDNGFEQNTLSHTEGVLSMARSGHPDSAGSQFFICDSDESVFLDNQYTAFGKVVSGIDLVKALALEPTNGDLAIHPRAMTSVTVDTHGYDWEDPEIILD